MHSQWYCSVIWNVFPITTLSNINKIMVNITPTRDKRCWEHSTWRYCYCDTRFCILNFLARQRCIFKQQDRPMEAHLSFLQDENKQNKLPQKKQYNIDKVLPWSWSVVCNALPPMGPKSSVAVIRTSRIWPMSAADIELLLSSSARSTLGGGDGKDGRRPEGNTSPSSILWSWLE